MSLAAQDHTDRFEGSIAALSRVTATRSAPADANIVRLPRAASAAPHDDSLGAELASSLMLILAVLVPILLVALVTR